jgi:hypothetical protein
MAAASPCIRHVCRTDCKTGWCVGRKGLEPQLLLGMEASAPRKRIATRSAGMDTKAGLTKTDTLEVRQGCQTEQLGNKNCDIVAWTGWPCGMTSLSCRPCRPNQMLLANDQLVAELHVTPDNFRVVAVVETKLDSDRCWLSVAKDP